MLLEVKFQGDLADQHKIPAYEGTKSLEGITRSILIVSSYLVEGKIRRREFERLPIDFNLIAHRPGSFESIYEIAYPAAVIGGPLALGVAGNLLTDMLKTVFRRVTGSPETEPPKSIQTIEAARGGDISALVDAVEPSVRLGHNVINHGVININITSPGASEEKIVKYTPNTKKYVWENVINNNIRIKIFSIGSFNANQGTGRAFDLEEGRSIPFEISNDADRKTVETILNSISSYTMKKRLGDNLRSAAALKYTSVDTSEGRVKKIRILSARNEITQL
ncbi:hypothetical protein M8994_01620 [Brucella sp. 21LCYQ03]|nr:hypothetical protein [Brucella sp. 21LCYQ03]